MIDDSHLLAASEDRTWTIWDMNTEKLSKIYRAAMGAVRGVAMGPDQVGGRLGKMCGSARRYEFVTRMRRHNKMTCYRDRGHADYAAKVSSCDS
jgi:hypothetical protein